MMLRFDDAIGGGGGGAAGECVHVMRGSGKRCERRDGSREKQGENGGGV